MNNDGKLDCFNFMRLVAAYLVLYGHMYLVAGQAEPMFGTFTLSGTGIAIFFCISGYLGTQSWQADPDFFVLAAVARCGCFRHWQSALRFVLSPWGR